MGRRSRGRCSFGLPPRARTWSQNRLARTWARTCRIAGAAPRARTGLPAYRPSRAHPGDACGYPGPIAKTNLHGAQKNATCTRCMEAAHQSNDFSASVGLSVLPSASSTAAGSPPAAAPAHQTGVTFLFVGTFVGTFQNGLQKSQSNQRLRPPIGFPVEVPNRCFESHPAPTRCWSTRWAAPTRCWSVGRHRQHHRQRGVGRHRHQQRQCVCRSRVGHAPAQTDCARPRACSGFAAVV